MNGTRVWNREQTEAGVIVGEEINGCGIEGCMGTAHLVQWNNDEITVCCSKGLDELENGDLKIAGSPVVETDNEPGTQFIFCIVTLDEEDAQMSGVDFFVEVSTKEFFDQNGHMQDGYEEDEYDELIAVMDKYGMMESSESSFECTQFTAEEITAKLNAEPNFSFSQEFQDFVDR